MLRLESKLVDNFVSTEELQALQPFVNVAHDMLENKTGAGSDFLGWVNLPTDYDKAEFARIKEVAEKIKNDSEIVLVIGIGGSYLGAKAVIEFLSHSFSAYLNNGPKVSRAGR